MRILTTLFLILYGTAAFADSARPIIGVAGSGPSSNSVRYSMAALWDAGAQPVLLDTRNPEQVVMHMAALNGVVIAGNSLDINPQDYAAEEKHLRTKNEDDLAQTRWDKSRDDYEYALIGEAVKRDIPLLGICSGAQRLNVALGGTLNQHVDGQLVWPPAAKLAIKTVQGSQLAAIGFKSEFKDNSIHHQHIERVADGFQVAAIDASDANIVEAIEPTQDGKYAALKFLKGVQWHPEYGSSTESKLLLRSLVGAARKHSQKTPISQQQAQAVDVSSDLLRQIVTLGAKKMRAEYGYETPKGELSR